MSTCTEACRKPSPHQAHCAACHLTFGSVTGFDRHRCAGACIDPATIKGQRLDGNSIWRFEGGENRAAVHSRPRGTPQTAETGPAVPRGTPEDSEAADSLSGGPA